MSYIGRGLQSGAFRQLDDISSGFDGSDTTHTMQVNSTNVTVGDVNQILLSLGGVIQKPGTDFTVSSSTLTFTTAPAANTSFFAILLGSDNGGTVTPTDASVTTAKLSGNLVTPGTLDVNGQELILDADADTSITADTDDQIDIRIAGADDFQFTANTFTAQSGSTITTPTLGVGNTKDLGAGIHIKTADSGASANAAADDLVIEQGSSGNGSGLSILSATDDTGNIFFGDSGDDNRAFIQYNHATDHMTITHEGDESIVMGGGRLQTGGETSGDVDAGGLCLNNGANDNQFFSVKNSDVAHGMTSFFETDTMLSMSKIQSANGGVAINTAGESTFSTMFQCLFTDANTATSTSAQGSFIIRNFKKASSGTGYDGVLDNNQNIFTTCNQSSAKFIVKADGDIYYDGADQGAYDSYDDAMLVRSWDLSQNKNVIDSKFDEFVKYNHEDLANAELVGREEDGTPNYFVSLTGMQRLHNGAIWQQYEKHQRLAEAVYEMAKEALGEDKADAILEKHDIKLLN